MARPFSDYMARREAERTPEEAELADVFAVHFSGLADQMADGDGQAPDSRPAADE